MNPQNQIKTIDYLKAHTAEIVHKLSQQHEPLIITSGGKAKVVMQGIESYEQIQESTALLKILALGMHQIKENKVQPAADVFQRLRERGQE